MKLDLAHLAHASEVELRKECQRLAHHLAKAKEAEEFLKKNSERTMQEMLECIESQNQIIEENNRHIRELETAKLESERKSSHLFGEITQLRLECETLTDKIQTLTQQHQFERENFKSERDYLTDSMTFEKNSLEKQLEQQTQELQKLKNRDYENQIMSLKKTIELLKSDAKDEMTHAENKIKKLEEEIVILKSDQWKNEGLKKVKFGMDQIFIKGGDGPRDSKSRREYNENVRNLRTQLSSFRKSLVDPVVMREAAKIESLRTQETVGDDNSPNRPRVQSTFSRTVSNSRPAQAKLSEDKNDDDEYTSLKMSEQSNHADGPIAEYNSQSANETDSIEQLRTKKTIRFSTLVDKRVADYPAEEEMNSNTSDPINTIKFGPEDFDFPLPTVKAPERCPHIFCFIRCLILYVMLGFIFKRQRKTA